jgi:hypothetical protein
MNPDHTLLLNHIANDKFAIGAFSGMVFNQACEHTLKYGNTTMEDIDDLIVLALNVRLRIEMLSNEVKQ